MYFQIIAAIAFLIIGFTNKASPDIWIVGAVICLGIADIIQRIEEK